MMSQKSLAERAGVVMTENYRPSPVAFERGDGMWLYDTEGRRYLDFAAGIAVSALGHNHPALVKAISEQARKVLHTSNLWLNSPCVEAMELLVDRSFGDRVFFGNSGAEAIEASLKIARRYMQAVRGEQRFEFITANESFHGRTWAAISATGQPKYHQGFAPLVPGFVHVPYGDLGAVEAALSERTCAVMVEPIQGEGGIIVPPEGYLEGLRALCDKAGILLIFDEVQTGVGRTGRWFGYEHTTIAPDVMALAKGLGGGVPVGAMVCTAAVAQGFVPGVHASTFGGNPLATSAVVAVMRTIEAEGLLPRVEAVGDQLGAGLDALVDEFDGLIEARGRGLLRGLAVDDKVLDRTVIKARAQERGLLVTLAGHDALRLTPPLIAESGHVEEALEILRTVIAEVAGAAGRGEGA